MNEKFCVPTGQKVEHVHKVRRQAAHDLIVVRQVDIKVGQLDDKKPKQEGTVGENERRKDKIRIIVS